MGNEDKEAKITALKAEIFDLLEAQERLQGQVTQIEQQKRAKVVELNKLRELISA